MTIIRKSPTPYAGHTFADVPENTLCHVDGVDGIARWGRAGTDRYLEPLDRRKPHIVPAPGALAVPLTLTPAEPKLNPAVTTYADAVGHFEWLSGEPHHGVGGICFASDTAYIDADGDTWLSDPEWNSYPVRILSPLEVAEHFATLAGAHVVLAQQDAVAREDGEG